MSTSASCSAKTVLQEMVWQEPAGDGAEGEKGAVFPSALFLPSAWPPSSGQVCKGGKRGSGKLGNPQDCVADPGGLYL